MLNRTRVTTKNRTQTRGSSRVRLSTSVSRADAGRDVLRHGSYGPRGPDVRRGPPHDGPALRPTDRRPARRVHHSTQSRDHRLLTVPCDAGPAGPCVLEATAGRTGPRGRSTARPKPSPGSEAAHGTAPGRKRRELARESAECRWRQLGFSFWAI